jgi:hypothetical protein
MSDQPKWAPKYDPSTHRIEINDEEGWSVAFIHVPPVVSFDQAWERALKIASAPELYEAVKGLVRYVEAVRHTAGMGKTQLERLDAAKAVLAKAEGQE